MVSHIIALGVIQSLRALAGLLLGGFLVFRSFEVPPARLPRLEPGDQTAFLVVGLLWTALGLARGAQGLLTLRQVAARRRRGDGGGGWAPVLWIAAALALLSAAPFLIAVAGQIGQEGASLARTLAYALRMGLVFWPESGLALGILLLSWHLKLSGRFVRRLGLAMAVVDLLDLTAFPLTTACGTYGLLVHRHPEALDFFEGVFSGRREFSGGTEQRLPVPGAAR